MSFCIVSGYFMYRFLKNWANVIFLGCNETLVIFLGCLKVSRTDHSFAYMLNAPPGLKW